MMSVHYTATWYDVMQARQHHTHLSSHTLSRSIAVTGSWDSGFAGVIGSKWRSSVLTFAADSDCIPIVGAVKS